MKKYLFIALAVIIGSMTASAGIDWKQVAPGVWKGVVGTPESYTLLGVADCRPQSEGLSRLPEAALPAVASGMTYNITDGKTALAFPLVRGEQIYGFGLNFKTVQQRGRIMELHVDHYAGTDNGRTHAPVPFYVSDEGYGVFINSARYIKVWAGSGIRKDSPEADAPRDRTTDSKWKARPYSDAVSMLVPGEGVEIYVFAGPTALDAVQRYNLFCGGGPLPPRWGLGFTQRTHTKFTAEHVKAEVDEFARRGFPLDFLGLEPGWQSKAYPCSFEWDFTRYPDPAGFIKEMRAKGVRINLWTNPYVSPSSAIYDDIYPHTGSHTVWCGIVPDFTVPEARRIWSDKLEKEHVGIGVSGYKIDEIDGGDHYLWPDVATFPGGKAAEQMRQTYGLWVQKITTDIYRKQNRRTYGLVRGSNGGGTSFPYVIYNDYYNHRDFITALINSGYCGVLWTPEVRRSKEADDWVRRFQTVAFSPMAMLNAWSKGMKPWSIEEVSDQVRDMMQLRERMVPYWYTAFARYHFDGMPPFRGMNLEPGFKPAGMAVETVKEKDLENNPYLEAVKKEIKDQYMAGEYLLVAPLFQGETKRKVVLPEGNWYDFYTGRYVGNGEVITVEAGLDKIPVFVKDGGIIPMTGPTLHVAASGEKYNLEIRHYGKADGSYRLYDDDGETYDYEKGAYSWREISVKRDGKGRLHGTMGKARKGKPDNIGKVTWRFMSE